MKIRRSFISVPYLPPFQAANAADELIELEAVAKIDPLIGKVVARLMVLSVDERIRFLYEAHGLANIK